MKPLWILGAGQYGAVAKEIAQTVGYDPVYFLDDNCALAQGPLSRAAEIQTAGFVAMGNPQVRSQWLRRLHKPVTLIHPNACVSPSACLGEGCIVEAGAVVGTHATVGNGTIVMAHAVVGHDAAVGTCCQLKYGCVVPERSRVPDFTRIDCGCVFENQE